MKSCALLRTNVALTTNVKLIVDSSYGLFLDSIQSSDALSDNRFRKFRFNKDSKWEDILPQFFRKTPTEVSFNIKYDNDADKMSSDFANQYDDLYQYGARNITANKFYTEEYEYFAPLHIDKDNIPTNFIIFRIDGPGIIKLDKNNFRQEIINKLKFVKNFDLSPKTVLGQWINTNFTTNNNYPNSSLYIDFRRMEFSSWVGIDYESGGYTEKTYMLDSTLETEQTYLDMERLILNGYSDNSVIYPNILNFSFLFDDTPATPDKLRNWSINRYLGFYFDELRIVKRVSPNFLPELVSDVIIESGNILSSVTSPSPFTEEWRIGEYPYIEVDGKYYPIEKFDEVSPLGIRKIKTQSNSFEEKITRTSITKYKILSDIPLTGLTYSSLNQNLITITSDGYIEYQNGITFSITDFDSADVWLMEIGDRCHKLVQENGKLKLYTDYGFDQTSEKFDYYINRSNPDLTTSISLTTLKDYSPVEFNIYKCKFTPIKDFDTDIVETDYSKFEYMKDNEVTDTDEPKMYMTDLDSDSEPKDIVELKLQNVITNIPVSSEYTSNSETFRIEDSQISNLWRKNSERLKWGFKDSISNNEYPYLLNNSFLSEDFNKSSDTRESNVKRESRNLDYFYTINSNSNNYSFHSLHVEDWQNTLLNESFKFELDKYLGQGYDQDYFTYFFGKKSFFNLGTLNRKIEKYSYFIEGDSNLPNVTLFKGLKFSLSEVENLNISDDKIQKINLKNSNKFKDWKFSILLSSNDYIITNQSNQNNLADIIRSDNTLKWRIIDQWKHEKDYATNSLVLFNEILYVNPSESRITDPKFDPSNSDQWDVYNEDTIFYNPNQNKSVYEGFPPLIYYYRDYYYYNPMNEVDIWDKSNIYNVGDVVMYGEYNWISLQDNNRQYPSEDGGFYLNSTFEKYWEKTEGNNKWVQIPLWKPDVDYTFTTSWSIPYNQGNYVVYEDVVWGSTFSPVVGVPPTLDSNWVRVYSLEPDTKYLYGPSFSTNNIIEMNNKFYQCVSSEPDSIESGVFYNYSLDNGIMVIINEKYKNVLVNIYINDNTYTEFQEVLPKTWQGNDIISNTNRDDIYTTIFSKLAANNFMNCINDLSNKFGFSDLVKYVVVRENSTVEIYDFNNFNSVKNLPYILTCYPPDEFTVKLKSLIKESVTLESSEIKAKRILKDSNIENISQLNYYNEMHLASKISVDSQNTILIDNFSGLKNQNYGIVYRHSGFYTPILREMQLFDSPGYTQSETNFKFDTDLSEFGIIKQRVISKVNRKNNILKLKNSPNLKSIYPMIDEFGYHVVDFFMFKSTWDLEYHYECDNYEPPIINDQIVAKLKKTKSKDFRNYNSKLL